MLAELERFEPFRRLAEHNRQMLERALVCKDAPRAAPILHKGQPVAGAYLVLEGRLRVFTVTPSGTEATLYFVSPRRDLRAEPELPVQRSAVSGLGAGRHQ